MRAGVNVKLVRRAGVGKLQGPKASVPAPRAHRLEPVTVNGNAAEAVKVARLSPVARVAAREDNGKPSGF